MLTPEQVESAQPVYARVPSVWTSYGNSPPAAGYATFRLKVLLPPGQDSLAIANDGQGSAYSIWVSGKTRSG